MKGAVAKRWRREAHAAFDRCAVRRKDERVPTKPPKRLSKAAEIAKLVEAQTRDGLRPIVGKRTVTLRESDRVADTPPPPARVNRADAPADFDAELGLILEASPDPDPVPDDAARARWVYLTTALVPLLGSTSAYRALMPIATPPDDHFLAAARTVSPRLVAALPELEALHRKLLPGWREIVENWLAAHALRRVEDRQRALREPEARAGKRVNMMAPRQVETGAALLNILRTNPAELMRGVPELLTAQMLDHLAQGVQRSKGGRRGGWTPKTAMAMLDRWLAEPKAFGESLKRRESAKKKRARRARRN